MGWKKLVYSDEVASLTANAPAAITPDATSDVGVGTAAARDDHVHAITASAAADITADATAAEGTATAFARSDHAHGFTTASPSAVDGTAAAEGTATAFVKSDHRHALGPLVAALDFSQELADGMVLETSSAIGATATTGTPDTGAEKTGQIYFSTATADLHAYIWTSTT